MPPTKKPDRDEYPEPSAEDFAHAVRRALDPDEGGKFTHHQKGRYTAYRTYVDEEPRKMNEPDEPCVIVTECERETIAILPCDHAETVLSLLEPYESDIEDVAKDFDILADTNKDNGDHSAAFIQRDAASHIRDKLQDDYTPTYEENHDEEAESDVETESSDEEDVGHGYDLGSVRKTERDS